MANAFQPKFVDLVRNTTTTIGTGNFALGPAAMGYSSFMVACQPGDSFYYSAIGVDKPNEREVGRGTLLANATISRDPISGTKTSFSGGTKTIALIAAAEWFSQVQAGSGAATRSAMAAMAAQGAVLLAEAGREGLFVWDGSNRAAAVAADPNQGINVALASNPSGSAGAWVRKYSGPVNVRWFGAKGDGVSDDGAAFVAGIAYLKATASVSNGNYIASSKLFVPAGHYYLGTTTLDITHTLIIEGEGVGLGGVAYSTKLRWAAGATGIRIQRFNTSGAGTVDGTTHSGGDGTILRGLHLYGGYAGVEAEWHGVHAKARLAIEDCKIENFQGDGVYAVCVAGSGTATEGNANVCRVTSVSVSNCRNGLYIAGADTNIWTLSHLDLGFNRQWGVWDASFLGNSYFGCHAEANGQTPGTPPTMVSHGGNFYCVKAGQEAGAATNAPSGSAGDNAWWYYISPGAPAPLLNINSWASGTAYRAGGSYRTEGGGNANNLLAGCYHEGGQGFAQLMVPTLVSGGSMRPNVRGVAVLYGGKSLMSDAGMTLAGNFIAQGYDHSFGAQSGIPSDNSVEVATTNSSAMIRGTYYNAATGAPTSIGSVIFKYGWGNDYSVTTPGYRHRFQITGTDVAVIDAAGLTVAGSLTSSGGGVGYAAGAGGSVTQATSKSTAVTLNKPCGRITTHAAALAAGAGAAFTVTNSQVAATDTIDLSLSGGNAAPGSYDYQVDKVSAGSFSVWLKNVTAGALSEALTFNFAVKKAVAA